MTNIGLWYIEVGRRWNYHFTFDDRVVIYLDKNTNRWQITIIPAQIDYKYYEYLEHE